MKETLKRNIYGIIIMTLHFIVSTVVIFLLIKTSLLTPLLIAVAVVGLLLITALICILLICSKKKIFITLGTMLALVSMTVQIIGSYYITMGASTLEEITVPTDEYSEIGVFVKKDDAAQSMSDLEDYNFGILKQLDRDATNLALDSISNEFSYQPSLKEYDGLSELFDALLLKGDSDAILLNISFLDVLNELYGHEEDSNKIRLIYSLKVPHKDTIPDTIINESNQSITKDYFTVYITGIDGEGGLSRRSRSDVNIIATINPKSGQILLVSTPRDYYVPLSISNGIPDKLTHAGIYGTNVSRDTLEMLFDIEIDYYFKVNFDGFKKIIDALGGITVYSEYSFKALTYDIVKGENFLNGEAALAFARERYNVASGDRQRGKHQMEVIRAVINKALGPALLKNYSELLKGVEGSFETDMSYEMISKLVQNQLANGTEWNTATYSVDGTGKSAKPYSLSGNAYVMVPNQATVDHAKELMGQVMDGKTPQP